MKAATSYSGRIDSQLVAFTARAGKQTLTHRAANRSGANDTTTSNDVIQTVNTLLIHARVESNLIGKHC